jgi:hypothetical protein
MTGSGDGEGHALSEDHGANPGGRSSESHADADLMGAEGDGVGDRGIEDDGGE